MKINYWNCKYQDYDELWDGETEIRIYGCSHKDKDSCDIDNKWGKCEVECPIAEALEDDKE